MEPTEGVILVVDDDEIVRNMVAAISRREGYHVLTADNAEAGLSLSTSYHSSINCLVSDIQMPGMNGIELANRIVQDRPGIRVLLVSGSWDQPIPESFSFLMKPFTVASLRKALLGVLRPVSSDLTDVPIRGKAS